MPDAIERLTYVKEDNTNLFSRIKSFTESIIEKCELVYCGIAGYEPRLKRSKKVVIFQMIVEMLKDEPFEYFIFGVE